MSNYDYLGTAESDTGMIGWMMKNSNINQKQMWNMVERKLQKLNLILYFGDINGYDYGGKSW